MKLRVCLFLILHCWKFYLCLLTPTPWPLLPLSTCPHLPFCLCPFVMLICIDTGPLVDLLTAPSPPSPAFLVRFDGLLDAFMSLDLSLLISFCCPLYCTNEWDHVKLKVLNSHTSFFFLVFYQTPHFEWSCWWPDKDYRYKKGLIIFIIFLLPKKWNK